MSGDRDSLIARWRAFLTNISERLDGICDEAGPQVRALVDSNPHDPLPIDNALSGLDHRIRQLRDRIEQVWDEQVEGTFSGGGGSLHDVGLDMKEDAELAFDHRWQRIRADWLVYRADAARVAGLTELDEPASCSSCGGPIPHQDTGQTLAITCEHCGAVVQLRPPPAIAFYYQRGIDDLAAATALPLRHEADRFQIEIERDRRQRRWAAAPRESSERREELERAYLQSYADERARRLGVPVDQAWVESRMDMFRRTEPA